MTHKYYAIKELDSVIAVCCTYEGIIDALIDEYGTDDVSIPPVDLSQCDYGKPIDVKAIIDGYATNITISRTFIYS